MYVLSLFIGLLIHNNICADGGISQINSRYKVLNTSILDEKKGEEELNNLTEILYNHAVEVERRSIARVNELVHLLTEGCQEDNDMWYSISKYFQENENDIENLPNENIRNKKPQNFEIQKNEITARNFEFDESAWLKVEALIKSEFLPKDDIYLIARFATGVNSPRLRTLRLSKNVLFGVMRHCEWQDILNRITRYLSQNN